MPKIALDLIETDPNQPRKQFKDIQELAADIRINGLIQPPVVTPLEGAKNFRLLAGERRIRALRILAQEDPKTWGQIEVVVREDDLSPSRRLILQLSENKRRNSLTPWEELDGNMHALELHLQESEAHNQKTFAEASGVSMSTLSMAAAVHRFCLKRTQDHKTLDEAKLGERLMEALQGGLSSRLAYDALNVCNAGDVYLANRAVGAFLDGRPFPADQVRKKLTVLKSQSKAKKALAEAVKADHLSTDDSEALQDLAATRPDDLTSALKNLGEKERTSATKIRADLAPSSSSSGPPPTPAPDQAPAGGGDPPPPQAPDVGQEGQEEAASPLEKTIAPHLTVRIEAAALPALYKNLSLKRPTPDGVRKALAQTLKIEEKDLSVV